jgi:hypothetical protein
MPGAPPNEGVFDFRKVVEIVQSENLIFEIGAFRRRTCPPTRLCDPQGIGAQVRYLNGVLLGSFVN